MTAIGASAPFTGDYFSGRPTAPSRPSPSVLGSTQTASPASPRTPRTPLLARGISSTFSSSPGSFRVEQTDCIVYELDPRRLAVGFSGEARPRRVFTFSPYNDNRIGDFCQITSRDAMTERNTGDGDDWGKRYELYTSDIRSLDLGLVQDRLERAVRCCHTDVLQLDQKPRAAVLAVPSLLPVPLLEIILKVLSTSSTQPPNITVLTTPMLLSVAAGLRNALVIDVGWEETVVTAVGEYREVRQRRSTRAGKRLTREVALMMDKQAGVQAGVTSSRADFIAAEDVIERMAWCRSQPPSASNWAASTNVSLPISSCNQAATIHVPFSSLAGPAESAFFASAEEVPDDNDLPLPLLGYRVLLDLPVDLRLICASRIIVSGGFGNLPGLKRRLLQDISRLIANRRWDMVRNYGSATSHHERFLRERDANVSLDEFPYDMEGFPIPSNPARKSNQDIILLSDRVHDDVQDPITMKAEREARKLARDVQGRRRKEGPMAVRGVHTLGSWAGASFLASQRVHGTHEFSRDDVMRYGLMSSNMVL